MNDAELIALLKKSPNEGIKTLTKQFAGLVYTVIHSKLKRNFDQIDIEICLADTFSDFFIGLDKFNLENGSIKLWLCTIARNKAVDLLRKRDKEHTVERIEEFAVHETFDNDIEDQLEDKFFFDELIEEIKELGVPDSEIIIRKYYFNQTSKEIATALGLTVSNVDTRAHRAIKRIREKFGGDKK